MSIIFSSFIIWLFYLNTFSVIQFFSFRSFVVFYWSSAKLKFILLKKEKIKIELTNSNCWNSIINIIPRLAEREKKYLYILKKFLAEFIIRISSHVSDIFACLIYSYYHCHYIKHLLCAIYLLLLLWEASISSGFCWACIYQHDNCIS